MLSLKRTQVAVKPLESCLSDNAFEEKLYCGTLIYRLILQRPLARVVVQDNWNPVFLAVVTELGLLPQSRFAKQCAVPVTSTLLEYMPASGEWSIPNDVAVSVRPLTSDAWDERLEDLTEPGVFEGARGGFEYKLMVAEACQLQSRRQFFLHIQPGQFSSLKVFPIVVGPVYCTDIAKLAASVYENEQDTSRHQMHRALPLLTHTARKTQYLTLKEQWGCGTPGKFWDSALVLSSMLAATLEQNPQQLIGKHVVDLSSGTGSIGLYLHRIQQLNGINPPIKITITDVVEALPLIQENYRLNRGHTDSTVSIRPLVWGNKRQASLITAAAPVDLLIASDILYNATDFDNIIRAFRQLSTPQRTVIYLGYKRRGLSEKEEQYFFTQCTKHFDVSVVHSHELHSLFQRNTSHHPSKYNTTQTFLQVPLESIKNNKGHKAWSEAGIDLVSMLSPGGVQIFKLTRKSKKPFSYR